MPRGALLEPLAEHRRPRAAIEAFVAHFDRFLFRSCDPSSRHRVRRYCAQLGEEMLQCALFDRNGPQAKLTKWMMGFTGDGRLDPVLLAERDREPGVASAEKRRQRAALPDERPSPGADVWREGRIAHLRGTVGEPPRGR